MGINVAIKRRFYLGVGCLDRSRHRRSSSDRRFSGRSAAGSSSANRSADQLGESKTTIVIVIGNWEKRAKSTIIVRRSVIIALHRRVRGILQARGEGETLPPPPAPRPARSPIIYLGTLQFDIFLSRFMREGRARPLLHPSVRHKTGGQRRSVSARKSGLAAACAHAKMQLPCGLLLLLLLHSFCNAHLVRSAALPLFPLSRSRARR
jgi:hypothetical protein